MNDDLWLKWMELKANIPCVLIENPLDLDIIEGTQETGLWHLNVIKKLINSMWEDIVKDYQIQYCIIHAH